MTTKQLFTGLVTTSLVLTPVMVPVLALAEDNNSSTTPSSFQQIREEYRQKVEEIRSNIKDTKEDRHDDLKNATNTDDRLKIRDEARLKIRDLREQRIGALADKFVARFTAALARESRFITRIQFILDQRATSSNPVTNASQIETKLGEAKTMIDSTQVLVNNLPNQISLIVASSTASTTVPAQFKAVHEAVSTIIQDIKDIHVKLVEAIKLI